MVEQIIDELFIEAGKGKIIIESENSSWVYHTKFLVNDINNKDISIQINNKPLFIKLIKEYLDVAYDFYYDDKNYYELNEKGYIKKLIFDLLVNIDNYDSYDIYSYIDKKINHLKEKKIRLGTFKTKDYLGYKISYTIKKNRSNLEAPYQFIIQIKDEFDKIFELPQITFAIDKNCAQLMCVQNKNKHDNSLVNKLDRYFRKVNKNVVDNEDISNISSRALISLTVFNSYLKNIGVDKIEVPSYLPIRYNSKILTNKNKNGLSKELSDQIDRDQFNMTNKLIYLMKRYAYHFKGNDFTFNDITNRVALKLKNVKSIGDNIIYGFDSLINGVAKKQ